MESGTANAQSAEQDSGTGSINVQAPPAATDKQTQGGTANDASSDSDDHPYTNRLINATSPYLLQHAHNPVDWFMWGEEAFEVARREDKPIFLSVGYSTCYWCHVMEREVFENPEIAALMNERFVNIKVDREQRPDIDKIYMTATHLMNQRGGWPNSVFLTPDLKPFYAGTYFGPEDLPGRPGFPTVVTALSDAYQNQRAEVDAQADRFAQAIEQVLAQRSPRIDPSTLTTQVIDNALQEISSRYDPDEGGFGAAPKFPQGFLLSFLLQVHERSGERELREMAVHTLRKMAAGGMYDHVGGGFHRYSTDDLWRVPHFEKMLYNQAQLMRVYARAARLTDDSSFVDVVAGIDHYVDRLMTGPSGQFYSALDAETDAVEGAYYVWTEAQLASVLTDDELARFNEVFALGDIPIYPGHKHPDGGVVYMRAPIQELADELGVGYETLRSRLDGILKKLEAHRANRKLPRLDDKVIAGWNGLMIGAYADAGATLGNERYIEAAKQAASFVLRNMRNDQGELMRIWRKGEVSQPAFLEDYAFMIEGLLELADATGDDSWIREAEQLAGTAGELFWDEQGGGGYFFAHPSPHLIARSKSTSDAAIPSGNSAMLHNLVELWHATGKQAYRERTQQMLAVFGNLLQQAPMMQLHMVHGFEKWLAEPDAIGSKAGTGDDNRAAGEVTLPGAPAEDFLNGNALPVDQVKVDAQPAQQFVAPGDTFEVRVTLRTKSGWHVNANPVSDPALIPTVVDIRGMRPIEVLDVAYPKGVLLEAAYTSTPIAVYEADTTIVIRARLSQDVSIGERVEMPVFIQYQACNDQMCLAPREEIINIELNVVE